MGGTFDPIHFGHLRAAEQAREAFGADSVIFIPSALPAYKPTPEACAEDRFNMCVLATESNPHFEVSKMELERGGETFTIDTAEQLKKMYPEAEIAFIIGADSLETLHEWHRANELFEKCSFVAVSRPGFILPQNTCPPHVTIIDGAAFDISSSGIRKRICFGKSVRYLLPESVERYIEKKSLYKLNIDIILSKAKEKLSKKRFIHTLGVVEEAAKLARIFGADEQKAKTAAALHDYARRHSTDKLIALCGKYGIKTDKIMLDKPVLLHAHVSAAEATSKFNITDEEIISAIKYHTTGKSNMSLLDKIIYVADMTEKNRENYKGLDELRMLSYNDIDAATEFALKLSIEFTEIKNEPVHPLSIEALNHLKATSISEE
jgi:nicotinate-nucleotide adenylyltransferase